MRESITKELRDCIFDCPHLKGVADRIDAWFDRELQAKQDEVDALRAKLDASMPLPVDADGSVSDVEACKVTLTNDDEAGER